MHCGLMFFFIRGILYEGSKIYGQRKIFTRRPEEEMSLIRTMDLISYYFTYVADSFQ